MEGTDDAAHHQVQREQSVDLTEPLGHHARLPYASMGSEPLPTSPLCVINSVSTATWPHDSRCNR